MPKKNNYSEIDSYILHNIFNKDFDKLYTLIYSGCCINKKRQEYKLPETDKKIYSHALSSINLIKDIQEEIKQGSDMKRTLSDKKTSKNLLIKSETLSPQIGNNGNSASEKESLLTQDEYDFELQIEETPSFDNNKIDDNIINNDFNSHFFSPVLNENKLNSQRKKILDPGFSLNDNIDNSDKKSNDFRNYSIYSELSIDSINDNISTYINYFNELDECYIKNAKKELMMNIFSIYFFDIFFNNENFKLMKNYYLQNFEGIQISTKLLDYPTKIKNFNNGLEPNLFLKPFSLFFTNKIFPITHKYYYKYMINNNVAQYEPIILYEKKLSEFYFKDKFDKKCELIKINHCYFGHIIGSKNINYIIFEQQKYDFYENFFESNKDKKLNINQSNEKDLNELFTLSNVAKKPFNKTRKTSLYLNDKEKKIFEHIKKYKKKKIIIILFDEIEEILERRFLLIWQAIEIYLKNGKSYFFNFLTKEQKEFILDIFKNNKITKNKIHQKDNFKIYLKNLLKQWQREELSTYEYLLFLNKYGSRSFNDVNQYPIFPWLIKKYQIENNNNIDIKYRNFKYPMGAQTDDNQRIALTRFQEDEKNGAKFPLHFGTHYSTSSYIYFYLMREEPFTTLLIKLQGYKHENPNRMFFSLGDTLFVLETGCDNRECIPDIFYKIEQFINLNCADYGCKNNGLRVDDFIINYNTNINNELLINNNNKDINNYVKFIIENKLLLDGKIISNNINEWFDNLFGIGQLPEKNKKNSLNIFNKETYEQKTNLHEYFLKLHKKYKQQDDIIKKIEAKIDLIISFGQTPYQLFNEKHPKRENKIKKNKEDNDFDDFESNLDNIIWEKNIKELTETQPLFFEINPSLGKIFLININRQLEIIDTNFYNNSLDAETNFKFKKYGLYQLYHIKFYDKKKIQDNSKYFHYIIKPKYSFSSFKEKDICNNNDLNNDEYISYYNLYINSFYNDNLKENTQNKKDYIRFITCRYMDNSFKIHQILKSKPKKEEKPLSIICEDFVSSCCTLNHNQFFIGLKNGKLIKWCIENENEINEGNYKILFNKQIQAHKKSINVIEINYRLGVIITAGEDNYVFIRKLYDFELLTPIKIKSKYIITMAKISPMNFLYIMCFNKKKKNNKSIILGYTVNGLFFAKSKYGYFDSLDFTKNGNIVTFSSKKEIEILSGNELKNIIVNKEDKEMNEIQKKIFGASWIKYNYFFRKYEKEQIVNKIITFSIFDKNRGGNLIETLDVSKIKYFD